MVLDTSEANDDSQSAKQPHSRTVRGPLRQHGLLVVLYLDDPPHS